MQTAPMATTKIPTPQTIFLILCVPLETPCLRHPLDPLAVVAVAVAVVVVAVAVVVAEG